MKYLIASDIHGSEYYTKKLIERFYGEGADKLILLGDIYNHGPRNPLPKDYNPLGVAKLLNEIVDSIIVIKGNCDSEVDTLISDFDFVDNVVIPVGEKSVFLSHGHLYNKDSLPKAKFNCVMYGHFHVGFIEGIGKQVIANPGSVSLPKKDTPSSYITLDENVVTLKTIDGTPISQMAF